MAIGTHDLNTVQGPFTYDAEPADNIKFKPLRSEQVLRGTRQVLRGIAGYEAGIAGYEASIAGTRLAIRLCRY